MANNTRHLSVGQDLDFVVDLKGTLNDILSNGYDYCSVPVAHPRFKRELLGDKSENRKGPYTRSDLVLNSYDWGVIVGKISPYINCDSSNELYRKSSEAVLAQELNYAIHLSLHSVIISIHGPKNANLARILFARTLPSNSLQIWIKVPLLCPSSTVKYHRQADNEIDAEETDTWVWWNELRTLAGSDKKLGILLEVGADLPSDAIINRWMGEPVRCVLLPTHIFLTNKKGFPVLSKPHQAFVRSVCQSNDVSFMIGGSCRHENISFYRKYIDHLSIQMATGDPLVTYAQGYEDFLQYPLQPLTDNLESQTYEVFEKDPVKYNKYQWAIYQALLDRVPLEEKDTNVQVVMVVGAGRGPLVGATLNAAKKSDRRVKVYAVEKNPNAVVTLESQREEIWGDSVTVVSCDMRDFDPPELADIVVSELLGSFGDNELSPECLDGAQKIMKDDAVSIPCSYTSFVSPIQSMKLYNEVRNYKERDKPHYSHFEMPYVVHQKNKFSIHAPKELFTFTHPNKDVTPDNSRYAALKFKVEKNCVLHGFSGYFSTVLYKDTDLSIVPETHSQGMFSWFPIYFPIQEPIYLSAGKELEVHFWRLVDKEKVWYEWCIAKPIPLPIHNPGGRSYSIKLH